MRVNVCSETVKGKKITEYEMRASYIKGKSMEEGLFYYSLRTLYIAFKT